MNNLNKKLKFIRKFQKLYPNSSIGGSIGLMLHGIDLKRDLSNSDLDIIVDNDEYDFETGIGKSLNCDIVETSDNSDFFRVFMLHDDNLDIKIEIAINRYMKFDVVNYEGHNYNVNKNISTILFKHKYAMNGHIKHIIDLYVLENDVRPNEIEYKQFCLVHKFPIVSIVGKDVDEEIDYDIPF